MSLVTYPNTNKPKSSGRASKRPGTGSGAALTFLGGLRNVFAAIARQIVNIYDAIAEARVQKAMIEAELYLNRYKHTPKNDDDLPIVR